MLKNINYKMIFATMIASIMLLISGCTDNKEQEILLLKKNVSHLQNQLTNIDADYATLKSVAEDETRMGTYETLMRSHIKKIKETNKDENVEKMLNRFITDTSAEGVVFKEYQKRYDEFKNEPNYAKLKSINVGEIEQKYPQVKEILRSGIATKINENKDAFKEKIFDEHFIDYINVLASLDKDISPVLVENVSKDAPFGSQFVGNPEYGQWVPKENGKMEWSFFEAYGMFRLIDDTFDALSGRSRYNDRYYYDNWSSKRNYSYKYDYYKDNYASNSQKQQYKKYETNLSKTYGDKKFDNKNLTTQVDKMSKSATSQKYSTNLVKRNSAQTKSSQASGSNGNKNSSYSTNLTKKNSTSSASHRGTSSKPSSKGGK